MDRYLYAPSKLVADVNKPVNRITYLDVARSIGGIKGINKVTTNRYMSYMKILFNFARKRGYITVNPLAEWQKKGEQPRRLQLAIEDLDKIYKAAAPHLQWIIKCGINLGLRPGPSELFSLMWSDINWADQSVTVRSAKTKRERVVYCSDLFMEDLKRMHQRATTPFVCEYRGRPIRKVRNAWRSALRRGKVGHTAVLYELRHLYATTLLCSGVDWRAVSELLGHQSAKMTLDTYAHCLPGAKRRAAGLVPLVGSAT